MLTDEERKALVSNKVRRSRETWNETKAELFLNTLENLIKEDGYLD